MKDLLLKLCSLSGTPGYENEVAHFAANELKKYSEDVKIDNNGNVIAIMGDVNAKNHIMLDAHIDQIGLVVTHITSEGFIKVGACGGIDPRVLVGSTLKILGKKEIIGIVCSIPPHLSGKDKGKAPQISDILIDSGLDKATLSLYVDVGDRVIFNNKPQTMLNDRINASCIDNRAGVCALIRCAEMISKIDLPIKVSIVLSVQEETGAMGAKTATYALHPDEAIVVDVSFASQPSVPVYKTGKLSKGPMIGISPTLSKDMYSQLIEIAQDEKISYQKEIMSSKTGTNADVISVSREGVKTGLLSIPERYMHTNIELVDLNDIESTSQLILAYIKRSVN